MGREMGRMWEKLVGSMIKMHCMKKVKPLGIHQVFHITTDLAMPLEVA